MRSNARVPHDAPARGAPVSGLDGANYPAGRRTASVLVGTALFVLAQLYAAIPLLAPLAAQLQRDVAFALATCFGLCYAVGFLVWGPVSDQYGRKRIMIIALSVLSVATVACVAATTVTTLAVFRGIQGFSAAGFAPAALAYLSEALRPRRRAAAIGAMSTAFLAAGIFGQVFASAISLALGWKWFFIVCGAVLAVAVLLIGLTVVEAPRQVSSANLRSRMAAVGKLAGNPAILLLSAAHITLLLAFVGMYTALGPHLAAHGLDASQVIWIRLVGLPGMFAALFTGRLATRLGMAGVARLGFLLSAVGLAGEAVLARSMVGVSLSSLVFVTGVALSISSMIHLFGSTAAPHRASGMALNGFMLFAGASVGPLAASAIPDFPVLLGCLAALLAAAALSVTAFIHRTKPRLAGR